MYSVCSFFYYLSNNLFVFHLFFWGNIAMFVYSLYSYMYIILTFMWMIGVYTTHHRSHTFPLIIITQCNTISHVIMMINTLTIFMVQTHTHTLNNWAAVRRMPTLWLPWQLYWNRYYTLLSVQPILCKLLYIIVRPHPFTIVNLNSVK